MKRTVHVDDLVRKALAARVAELDAGSLSRLRRVRATAVDRAGRGTRLTWPALGAWVPAGAVAGLVGAVAGIAVWLHGPTPELETYAGSAQIVVEMAKADVDIELLEEMEFYDWLALTQGGGGSA